MIKTMMRKLVDFPEMAWGLYGFSRDPIEGKFSLNQKLSYIDKAIHCGREEAELYKQKYGSDIRQAVTIMGLKVERPMLPVGGDHVIFAQYVEPANITIFMDCVEKAERLFCEERLFEELGPVDVEGILLAHELFHAIEYQQKDSIFTQVEKVELWRRPFSNKSKVIALSEIAGMTFATNIYDLPYSAFLFDVLFMYVYHQDGAKALYEELLEIREELGC